MNLRRPGLKVRGLSARVAVVVAAYIGSAVVVVGAVYLARRALSPEPLRAFLSYLVIVTISAGLEPGTTKAQAVAHGADGLVSARVISFTSLLKALAVSGPLALIWSLSDPKLPVSLLALTPLICTVGFVVTDLRVRYDLEHRHAVAIGIKQGATATGLLLAAVLMASGWAAFPAMLVATLSRFVFLLPALWRNPTDGPLIPDAWRLLTATPWQALAGASALSAAGGSLDRLIGIRVVGASDLASYYLIFEFLSKFWLLPYLLTPILFARRVAQKETAMFDRIALGLVIAAGAAFLIVLALTTWLAPSLARGFVGRNLDGASLALGAAIAFSAVTQILITQQQALGRGRRIVWLLVISLLVGLAAFGWAGPRYGVEGLMWAWLVRSTLELACTLVAALIP